MSTCTHTHTMKFGKRTYTTGTYQMRLCKDCGHAFRGERIENKVDENRRIYMRLYRKYKEQQK